MKPTGPWSTEDFPSMSWHDVHVHGIALEAFEPESGFADLLLDIDYIAEWNQDEPEFKFKVGRAELRFEKVFGLRISLDYASPSAGMCPFSLSEIEREEVTYQNGHRSFKWRLNVNWPSGYVDFESPGFKQRLIGELHEQSQQWLSPQNRGRRIDA